jgi:RNA polymerase sigma-70 factor (ECF subfamily)
VTHLAWIWRVAFRVAAGELKERRKLVKAADDGAYEMPEPAWEIIRALARLSPMQRAAIVLHHYGGYPSKEIAVILGSTSAAVRVHLSAGRRRLREMLEESADV